MNFLYPGFLWALTALAIPLAIHLFQFRRYRTLYFPQTRFLQQVQQNTRSLRRLRHWFILLLRMLALAALVFAFARPYFPASGGAAPGQKQAFALYLDNSYSMTLSGPQGPLLNQAREQAARLISSLPRQARVRVLTNDFTPRQQRYHSPSQALRLIDQIQPSPAYRPGTAIQERIKASRPNVPQADSSQVQVFWFSDFQQQPFGALDFANSPQWRHHLIPLQPRTTEANLSIDSLWWGRPVLQPGFEQTLRIRVRNHDSNAVKDLPLKTRINGQLVGSSTLTVPALSTATATFYYTPQEMGHYRGRVQIEGESISFDNTLYFAFSTRQPTRVVSLDLQGELPLLERLYADSLFQYQSYALDNIDYGALAEAQLVLVQASQTPSSGLIEALQKRMAEGGHLWLVPSRQESSTRQWFQALNLKPAPAAFRPDTLRARTIHRQDPFYEGVFEKPPEDARLPRVYGYYPLPREKRRPLLSLSNGDPLVAYYPQGAGKVFVSAVPPEPESSAFYRHPIAVPLLLNAALFQASFPTPYLRAGRSGAFLNFPLPSQGEQAAHLETPKGELIPPQRQKAGKLKIFLPPSHLAPGQYPLRLDTALLGYAAVNGHPQESILRYRALQQRLPAQTLAPTQGGEWPQQIETNFQGEPLSSWFIGFGLLMLLMEMATLKLWRS
ncbi:MAG: BatA domain-containing protein [Schleiferiaceae bacterium]|jgi:hypothetical protein|nr:BatA domain-containing protein [Schleiferiaceae bacterium]